MPRVSPAKINQVAGRDPLLALLLPVCRSEDTAARELRWMREELQCGERVRRACERRSRSEPLQYVLGTQPFGALSIACRRKVLIPRWETEEWSLEVARRWRAGGCASPHVIDLCTGTGCVALLLKQWLPHAEVAAVDCSPHAVALARFNARRNDVGPVHVIEGDVLVDGERGNVLSPLDLVVCNPPYIPRSVFVRETATAVRLWEPRLALVGDKRFYRNLYEQWLSRTRSFVYEIGDRAQAEYVARHVPEGWRVGMRHDASGKPRAVYGYRSGDPLLDRVYNGFGSLFT